jgi:DNA-binding response OmpR family regulator
MSAIILTYAVPAFLHGALADSKASDLVWRPFHRAETGALKDWSLVLAAPNVEFENDLRSWREQGLRAPVIGLGNATALTAVNETIELPVRLGVLLERICFYLRPTPVLAASVLWQGYVIHPSLRQISREDQPEQKQSLTEKELALMLLLARESGRIWHRDDLLREIWGYDPALETHTLETHIYRLRRKLAELGGGGDIVTAAEGYTLTGQSL